MTYCSEYLEALWLQKKRNINTKPSFHFQWMMDFLVIEGIFLMLLFLSVGKTTIM